jgi:hypothetical protein
MNILKKSSISNIILLISLAVVITACTSVQVLTVKTNRDYNKVWKACLDSLSDLSFSPNSTDKASGLIIAGRAQLGSHNRESHLNIQVSKDSGSTTVVVKFIPPPGTVGGNDIAEYYVKALKKRIPDLKTIITN